MCNVYGNKSSGLGNKSGEKEDRAQKRGQNHGAEVHKRLAGTLVPIKVVRNPGWTPKQHVKFFKIYVSLISGLQI